MKDDLENYCELWANPERYVLVATRSTGFGYLIVRATSLAPLVVDTSDDILAEIGSRMRAAGVEQISLDEHRRRLREPRYGRLDPQHVYAAEPTSAHHVRLADGRFQRVFAGPTRVLHTGFEHILARADLAMMLAEQCADDVEVTAATIVIPSSGEELFTHREIRMHHELTPDDLLRERHPRAKAWHSQRDALFVAPEVRDAVVEAFGVEVAFAPGFSVSSS